ncbi:hypothetical protein TWF694_006919 [Orbilia ellipsospora]|uniref:Uncharacterized protein n=1 Tax=Orbilia ellipsospora TaxID=2528407 RepID=A0AAV9XTC6_9PEZI
MPVPRHASITPSTPVSIILKQDQPTGRQVTGIVSEILTRGDHPRGVKVRLKDGRVGRVQQIITDNSPLSPNLDSSSGYPDEDDGSGRVEYNYDQTSTVAEGDGGFFNSRGRSGGRTRGRGRGRGRGGGGSRFSGMTPRDSEGAERSEATYDLTAFIKDGRKGGKGKVQRSEATSPTVESAVTVRCPVCGDFEGDERAVEYHVESHFS